MSKHCPYCFSDQIVQVMNQQVNVGMEQALQHQPPLPRLAHRFQNPTFTAISIAWWNCRCCDRWGIQ
jgi:hypothetical protein